MLGDTCDHTWTCPRTCEISSKNRRANITIKRAIAHAKYEHRCRNCNTSDFRPKRSFHARRHVRSHVRNFQQKSPVSTSLSTVRSHMRNTNFIVATAILLTVAFCIHNSALPCFTLNEMFDIFSHIQKN